MALPSDAYPIATASGQQIRLDMVRPEKLDYIVVNSATGTAVSTSLVKPNGVYVLLADVDCIIHFTGIADKLPVNASALVVTAGERVTCMLPPDAVSFSAIGLSASGTLYVQTVTNWAGIANITTMENL